MSTPTAIPVTAANTWDSPTWAEGTGDITAPGTVGTGLVNGDGVDDDTFNYSPQHMSRWIRAMRDRMIFSDRGLFTNCLLPGSGTWSTGGATLNGTLTPAYAVVDFDDDGGVVVEYNVPVGAPHLFTASRDTYVGLGEDGTVQYQEVANGAGAPAWVDKVPIWKVVTNGSEITSAVVLVVEAPHFRTIAVAELAISGDVEINGDLDVDGTLDVGGAAVLGAALSVTGLCTFSGSGLIGTTGADSWSFTAAVSINNNSTIGSSSGDTCTVNAITTFANAVLFNGDVTLGNAAGDAITCTGTLTISNNSTIGSDATDTCTVNATLTINNSSTIGSSSTDTCVVNATTTLNAPLTTVNDGLILNGVNNFANGSLRYGTKNLTIGDGAVGRDIRAVYQSYIVSDTTGSATADITGCLVSTVITDNQWVYIRASASQTMTGAGNTSKLQIRAYNGSDSVAIINLGDDDIGLLVLPASVGSPTTRPNSITVRWKPTNDVVTPNNTGWTIQLQHGCSAGSLMSSNVLLEVWYA